MPRILFVLAVGCLLAAFLVGCDSGTGGTATPDLSARATSIAQQREAVLTYSVIKNATSTVTAAEFARVKPLLKVDLSDGGPATPPGTAVQIIVGNQDALAHQVVIRLYDRTAPLATQSYAIAALTVPANGTATTTKASPLPFAQVAAQIQQIDGTWDFGPPTP